MSKCFVCAEFNGPVAVPQFAPSTKTVGFSERQRAFGAGERERSWTPTTSSIRTVYMIDIRCFSYVKSDHVQRNFD